MLSVSSLGIEPTLEVAATSSSTPALDFFRLEPLGGFASASLANAGTVTDPLTDEVDFTFFAEAEEVIAAVAIATNPAAVLTVEYVEGASSTTASTPGGQAILSPTNVSDVGLATIRVTATVATDFTINIYQNTALEADVGESNATNKLDLSASKLNLGGERFAALGNTSLHPTRTTIYSEDFQSTPGYTIGDLWHYSDGRTSDGLSNHSGRALYFGQAEAISGQFGTLHWDASLDASANNAWESVFNTGTTTQWSFASTSNPGSSGSASNLAGSDEWYTFGAAATMRSIESSRSEAATEDDVSWELVFRPREFNGTHILFETGGNGDGTVILLDGETIEVRVQDDDDPSRRVVRNFTLDAVNDVNKFHHVAVTVHPDSTSAANSVRLFVNGVEVGSAVSATGVLADWAGTDNSGLGAANGAYADDDNTTLTGNFDGDIASLRYHEGRLLNAGEVNASYNHLVNDFPYVVGNYGNGSTVTGDAVSPAINLVGGTAYSLSFDSLINVEEADEPFELLQVLVRDTSNNVEDVLLNRFDESLSADTNGEWVDFEADLTSYAGKNVQIIFRFDSGDDNNNNFEGWWVDDVRVSRADAPATVDEDQFTIDLTDSVGQSVDILLAGQSHVDYSGQTLELRDSTGALVATGAPDQIQSGTNATNYDLGILGYEVTTAGVYSVRVLSGGATVGSDYAILVTPGIAMETESNNATDSLRSIGSYAAAGYLRSEGQKFYTSRSGFDADNPGLPLEDFEGGVVDDNDVAIFGGPLSSSTSNTTFPAGIVPGMVAFSGVPHTGNLALVGADFFDTGDPGSKAIGGDDFAANTSVLFNPAVTSLGFDVIDDGNAIVNLYNADGAMINSRLVDMSVSNGFFGVTSATPISRVEITEVGVVNGELIDNVAFGSAGVLPSADTDSFTVNLRAGQSVQVSTDTPLDNGANSPLNNLNPQLKVSGPGMATIMDLNSGPDGKNAQLRFSAPVSGEYTITVGAQSGAGEYIVYFGGDYNRDGAIDAADFTAWRDTRGQSVSVGSGADGNRNGVVDNADYDVWVANFGLSLDAQVVAAAITSASVPRQASPAAAAVVGVTDEAPTALDATMRDANQPTGVSFTPVNASGQIVDRLTEDEDAEHDVLDRLFADLSVDV